ncbi:MAG: lysylphosphatidylglycerol synthase domain-containing protein [Chitinophagaceae bacterium]
MGPVLLILICYHVYNELSARSTLLSDKDEIINAVKKNGLFFPLLALVFMILQLVIESIKWKLLMDMPSSQLSWVSSFKMVLAGQSFSFVTPNRSGDFIGRVMLLPDEKRSEGVMYTFYNAVIQIVVYSLLGAGALLIFDVNHLSNEIPLLLKKTLMVLKAFSPYVLFICLFVLIATKFIIQFLLRFPLFNKVQVIGNAILKIEYLKTFLLVLYNLLKSLITVFQYWIIFSWLGIDLAFSEVFIGVSIMIYGLIIMPTISFIELGLRWEFSFVLFSAYTNNLLGITLCAGIIWFLNIVIPAIIGAIWLMFKPVRRS